MEYMPVIVPIAGLAWNILIQVISCRFWARLGLLKSVFLGFGFGFVVVAILHMFLLREKGNSLFITNIMIYFSLGYCYFHFINMSTTARRIRILRELNERDAGMTTDEVLAIYDARHMVQLRLDRLLNNGQVRDIAGKLVIGKPTMLYISRIIGALKKILYGGGN